MYSAKTPPRAHQKEALRRLAERPAAFALLAEMGTGKSWMICTEFGIREAAGEIQDLLIIAPAGSYLNWCEDKSDIQPSQFKAHLSDDLFGRLMVASWKSSAGKAAKAKLEGVLATRDAPRALVVNIEALSTPTRAVDVCREFLSVKGRGAMIVVDESTTIKSRKSQRTKTVLELGQLANARRILTGMVSPKSPLDVFTQYQFLDPAILGQKSFFGFQARYAKTRKMTAGGRTFLVVDGFQNLEELQRRLAPSSYRVLKEDCLDLPPKIYQTRKVTLTDEQTRMYNEIKKFATSQIEGADHVTATTVLAQMTRLHQVVCGQAVDELGVVHSVPSRRVDAILDVLEEHAGKVIIWATYRHNVEGVVSALVKAYGTASVAQFHGGNKATRGEDERRFLNDPDCRFMVSTQAAGGRGNTWVVANLVIYFSNNYDLELRAQSEDRAHRDGLKHAVTYVDLVAEGTVDEKIIQALRNKLDLTTAVTGENYREWLI